MVSKNSSPNLKFKRGCLMIVMLITFSLALSSQDLVLRYHPPSNTIRGFQQNIGQFKNENNQTNENVKYSLALPGMNVCINESGFSYNTYKIISEPRNPFKSFQKRDLDIYRKNKVQVHRIDVVFEGMNPDCKLVPLNNINSKKRYINRAGKCENANSFQQITYKNIYPNIDLECIVNNGSDKPFEYNFILYKNAKLSDIRIKYAGALEATFNEDKITFRLTTGELSESIPASWYKESGLSEKINYQLISNNNGEITVDIKADAKLKVDQTLIIDPTPTFNWGTYFGGEDYDYAFHSTIDKNGNIYITGLTQSGSSISTEISYQAQLFSERDAFVTKFNPTGQQIYSTYFGGYGDDYGNAGFVDKDGNYYLVGQTYSDTFFTTFGAHQESLGGSSDGFIAKFDTSGYLIWNTYYGGALDEILYGIDGDTSGNIYVVGESYSSNNISTTGAHQEVFADSSGNKDGIIAKFNADGDLQWGTYFGGKSSDWIASCKIDLNNNLVVAFSSFSDKGMATSGAYQPNLSGNQDAGIAKFNSSGNLIWSTYYGGTDNDLGMDCDIDLDNNIVFTGYTSSLTGIASAGTHQTTNAGGSDCFLAKLNENGARIWGTYIGSTIDDITYYNGLDIDKAGNIYFCTGVDSTSNNFHSSDGYKTTIDGSDALIMKFNANGIRKWGTYFGGESNDVGISALINDSNQIITVGYTESTTNIATNGAFQDINNGATDIFIAQFQQANIVEINIDSSACDSLLLYGKMQTNNNIVKHATSDDTLNIVNLTINKSTNSSLSANACGSYELNNIVYGKSGTFKNIIPNAKGCDSVINLNLSLTPSGIDAEFLVASQLITKNLVSIVNISQYKPDSANWILPVSASVKIESKSDSQILLTFSDTGSFSIGLRTFQGACSQYTNKTIRVLDSKDFPPVVGRDPFIKKFNIFPNPTSNLFTTEVFLSAVSDIRLRIFDPINNYIINEQVKTGAKEYLIDYNLTLKPGVYIMLLETAKGNLISRFVIQ